jgi:hypothetical protein
MTFAAGDAAGPGVAAAAAGLLTALGFTTGVGFTGTGVTGVPMNMRWKREGFLGFGVGESTGEGDGEADTLRILGLGVTAGDASAAGVTAGDAAGAAAGAGDAAGTADTEGVGETFGLCRILGFGVGVTPGAGVGDAAGAHSAVRGKSNNAASTARRRKSFLIRFPIKLIVQLVISPQICRYQIIRWESSM